LFTLLSVSERLKIVDNLPFIDEEMWTEVSHIEKVLAPYCEYTYEQIPFPGNENTWTHPSESPAYIEAKNWYNTLSSDSQKRIDILIQANMPWG
jgi:hypothetical protein